MTSFCQILCACCLTYNLVILISTAWSDRRDDAVVNNITKIIISRIGAVAKELEVANRYLYINYASAAQADEVFAGYGERNWQRLRDVQRSVDPRGILTSKGLWKGFIKLL